MSTTQINQNHGAPVRDPARDMDDAIARAGG